LEGQLLGERSDQEELQSAHSQCDREGGFVGEQFDEERVERGLE
jgi:hypothetical protein